MRLVHAADLHLDSPLRGLERYEGAPVERMRAATRRAFQGLVDYCRDDDVRLLLLAGDLFDGDWKDYSTGLFFVGEMTRLRQAGVRVAIVRGNHDAASHITRHLKLPDNVVEFPANRPSTVIYDELGLALHGQSFGRRAVEENLAINYPDPTPGLCNFGLLHTCASGREGHESYAPCSLDMLVNKGYDYWALGHVHQREVLAEEPWVVFSGNLQGRHARELGPKGASVIEVEDGRVTSVVHRCFDVVRWVRWEVDVSGASDPDELLERIGRGLERAASDAEGRTLAVRLVLTGVSALHRRLSQELEHWENQVRALCSDAPDDGLWLERLEVRTHAPIDLDAIARQKDALGQVLRSLRTLPRDSKRVAELVATFSDLQAKLPREVREGEEPLKLDDAATFAELLGDIEQTLVPRLLESVEAD